MSLVRLAVVAVSWSCALPLSACGSSTPSAQPTPRATVSTTSISGTTFIDPIGAPPTYLGAVTSTLTHMEGADDPTALAPPGDLVAKFDWPALKANMCSGSTGSQCTDPHAHLTARLGVLTRPSFGSPYVPANGLVYYLTTTGIRCDTIIVSPPAGGQPTPWPTWCQSMGFVNAETGETIGGGVGPMPGQTTPATPDFQGPLTTTRRIGIGGPVWTPPRAGDLPAKATWTSIWSHVCPTDGKSAAVPGAICAVGRPASAVLARVTITDQFTDKLMYVVTWQQANCVSLGGPHRSATTPSPDPTQPHVCTVRSYIDATTGHDEYDTAGVA